MSLPPEPPPLQDIQSADALYTRVLARGRRLRRERRAFFMTAAMSLVLLVAAVGVTLTNDDPAQLAATDRPTTTHKTTTTFRYTLEPNPNASTTTTEVPATVAGSTVTTTRPSTARTTRTTARPRRSAASSSSASGTTTSRPASSPKPTPAPATTTTTIIPSSAPASACSGTQPALVDHAIAFVRGGDIWLAPIGGGPPQQVTTVGDASKPAWLPNGTSLVFVRPGGLATVTPGFPSSQLTNSPGDTDPAYSPDGQQIAFTRGGNIVRMPAGGGSVQVVRNEDAPLGTPTWSPDSCDIAFTWKTRVLKARRDGTGVTSVRNNASEPSWGSGNRIAVVESTDVVVVNPDSSGAAALGTGGGRVPTWKSDGSAVAFRLPGGIAYRIVGGDMTTVPGTQAGDTDPAW